MRNRPCLSPCWAVVFLIEPSALLFGIPASGFPQANAAPRWTTASRRSRNDEGYFADFGRRSPPNSPTAGCASSIWPPLCSPPAPRSVGPQRAGEGPPRAGSRTTRLAHGRGGPRCPARGHHAFWGSRRRLGSEGAEVLHTRRSDDGATEVDHVLVAAEPTANTPDRRISQWRSGRRLPTDRPPESRHLRATTTNRTNSSLLSRGVVEGVGARWVGPRRRRGSSRA